MLLNQPINTILSLGNNPKDLTRIEFNCGKKSKPIINPYYVNLESVRVVLLIGKTELTHS